MKIKKKFINQLLHILKDIFIEKKILLQLICFFIKYCMEQYF